MSPDTLEDQGLNFTPTSILTPDEFGEHFDSIKSETSIDKMEKSWNQMTSSVMMMVYVVTVVAVIMAFLVLYNLGILSFTEMEREIATLKVLGFKTNVLRKLLLTQNFVFHSHWIYFSNSIGILLHDLDDECCRGFFVLYSFFNLGKYFTRCFYNVFNICWC